MDNLNISNTSLVCGEYLFPFHVMMGYIRPYKTKTHFSETGMEIKYNII